MVESSHEAPWSLRTDPWLRDLLKVMALEREGPGKRPDRCSLVREPRGSGLPTLLAPQKRVPVVRWPDGCTFPGVGARELMSSPFTMRSDRLSSESRFSLPSPPGQKHIALGQETSTVKPPVPETNSLGVSTIAETIRSASTGVTKYRASC